MKLQTYAYCVIDLCGYNIETMRFTKKESIKSYMQLKYGVFTDMTWNDIGHKSVKCIKVELKTLTQLNNY